MRPRRLGVTVCFVTILVAGSFLGSSFSAGSVVEAGPTTPSLLYDGTPSAGDVTLPPFTPFTVDVADESTMQLTFWLTGDCTGPFSQTHIFSVRGDEHSVTGDGTNWSFRAYLAADPSVVGPCLAIHFSAAAPTLTPIPSPTPFPTATPTMAPVPLLYVNGVPQTSDITLPSGAAITFTTDPTSAIHFWDGANCVGSPAGSTLMHSYGQGFTSANIFSLRAFEQNNLSNAGVCVNLTWAAAPTSTPTNAPTATATPVPVLTINGSTDSPITVSASGYFNVEFSGIGAVDLYEDGSCNVIRGELGTNPWVEPVANFASDGEAVSFRGFTFGGGTPLTDCRVVNVVDPTVTPTVEPSPTPSDTPTLMPTSTATDTPSDTPTLMPTDTATSIPTDTVTLEPTNTTVPTIEPTSTAIAATSTTEPSPTMATSTATTIPTMAPTTAETGSAAVTLTTGDGGTIPDGAQVCVGTDCQTVGAGVSSAAVSGPTITFGNLDPGTYPVTVTNAAPYQDATGSVDVVAGETASFSIDLQLVPPTQAAASPVVTQTIAPNQPTAPAAAGGPSGGSSGGNTAPPVKSLPNTGSGQTSDNLNLLLLLGAISLVLVFGSLGWRRQRGQ